MLRGWWRGGNYLSHNHCATYRTVDLLNRSRGVTFRRWDVQVRTPLTEDRMSTRDNHRIDQLAHTYLAFELDRHFRAFFGIRPSIAHIIEARAISSRGFYPDPPSVSPLKRTSCSKHVRIVPCLAMGWVILNTNFEPSSYGFSPNEPLPLFEKFSRRLQAGLSGESVV